MDHLDPDHREAEQRDGTRRCEIYGLDIETDTSVDGLNPLVAPIVAVALVGVDRSWHFAGPERALLAALDATIRDLGESVLATWNGARFDLPYIFTRAGHLEIDLGLKLRADPTLRSSHDPLPGHHGAYRARWWSCRHIDGYRLYRNDVARVLGTSCGLKSMARVVGLGAIETDRSALHRLDAAALRAYVTSDARVTRELVTRRLPGAMRFIDVV